MGLFETFYQEIEKSRVTKGNRKQVNDFNDFAVTHLGNKGTQIEPATHSQIREGPPYPDGLGRVKCFYCARLVDLVCTASKGKMNGISLLRTCARYEARQPPAGFRR